MDKNRFDAVTRSLGGVPSRRTLLRALAGAGFGLGIAHPPYAGAARKKRKPRITRNAFGCVDVGRFCKRADQCCSGVCAGKPGKKRCRAHDTGGCRPGAQDGSCTEPATDVPCTTSAGNTDGYCNTTTGGAGFCAYSGGCFACTRDAQCQELYGPRAACIRCDKCADTGGTSCAHA